MKHLLITFITLALSSICNAQEIKEYLVLIFHEDWKKGSLKWNTGDYLWIVPYATDCRKIANNQIKPLFVTKDQIFTLEDKDLQNSGVGDLPVVLNDKSDINGYALYKNKKLIQRYDYKFNYASMERVLNVYAVPIKANCKEYTLGYYKKDVIRIDGNFEVWHDFWKHEATNSSPYMTYDFSSFNFVVSYHGQDQITVPTTK